MAETEGDTSLVKQGTRLLNLVLISAGALAFSTILAPKPEVEFGNFLEKSLKKHHSGHLAAIWERDST